MKSRIGILIIIFTSYIIGHGQQQAVPIWEHNSHINALPFLVQESTSGNFLMYTKDDDPNFDLESRFCILDKDGKQKSEKLLLHDSLDIRFLDVIWSDAEGVFIVFGIAANTLFLEGNIQYNSYRSMVTLKVDENLNFITLDYKKLESAFGYSSLKVYNNQKEYLVVLSSFINGSGGLSQSTQFETAFVRVKKSGQIVSYDYIKDGKASCQCVVPIYNSSGYYCPGPVGYNLDSNFIFKEYETNRKESVFHFKSTATYPKWTYNFLGHEHKMCFPWTNGDYLLSNTFIGPRVGIPHKPGNTIIFLLSHTNSDTIRTVGFGSGYLSFLIQTMDVSSDSMIYAGNNNYQYSEIAKFDKNLNKIWQIQYSFKDYNQNTFGIKASKDNGFYIYGIKKKISMQDNKWTPFLARFDKNGGFVSSTDGIEFNTTIKVYPNPFAQYLQLELQTSGGEMEFRLFDLNGRNVFVQHHLETGVHTLDLSALPVGTYIYKIYQSGKEISSDKCVKIQE
ncbi:MAG: T9SS type A sorting domain-containing protein [Saprospiraceae bacterium]|nr:T9SS type A sorting domain-containing protein [Saprospiraceae bacterium]